ncbi:carbohydrate binding domain protein [Minicystis rosea]|nr:carbohydrate binding domain protein [Minicystis rosea]
MKTFRIEAPMMLALVLAACGGGGNASTSGGGHDPSGSGGTGGAGNSSSSTGTGGAPSKCEAFGHFGTPTTTLTLPGGTPGIYYNDIQASFPEVDWQKLDRLYIPAGKYKYMTLGNLPHRDASHPLVITNSGGQVQVGPNDAGAGYIWSVTGGSNWILTGRYDPDSKTGDAAFPGHRCGEYADSRGKYGFLSDDAFAKGQYLHMGIAVTNASDFELEFLEITRSGFAGIRLLNQYKEGDPFLPMNNVRVHDNYVHDTDGEGFYIGWTGTPPSNKMGKLIIYNNRIIRTGNEALQIQNLGDGTEVHHNVVAFAALHWRDNGLGKYQDGNSQVQVREGTVSLHHNVFMGGAGLLLSFFSSPETGDGARQVTFSNNYFADTLSLGGYFNGTSAEGSSYTLDHNFFRGLDFGYTVLDPAATDPGVIFSKNTTFTSPITFSNNTWEGSRKITYGLDGANGTTGNWTASGNTNGPVTPVAFVQSGYPSGVPTRGLEAWAPKATVSPGSPDIVYQPGALVMYDAEMYECTKQNTALVPKDHPEAWKKLPLPIDDMRVVSGSPYAEMGVY